MPSRPKLIYIVSLGHSGSTLLDLLISGHPAIATTGEAKNLNPASMSRKHCCCTELVSDCPFWRRVARELWERNALRFRDLDVESPHDATFESHNLALFAAVRAVTGRSIIVDSSKNTRRLRRLLNLGHFEIKPVHLVRAPQGYVYSKLRGGRHHWLATSRRYARVTKKARALLRDVEHARVRYEDLATDPAQVLSVVMPGFGLDFLPQQLDWSNRERHDAGGNRMRRRPAEIRPDYAWKRGLGAWQKVGISVCSRLPVLVRH